VSDRAALYAAVCANPDEDTPRLVFADWLQEHGEEKRASLIRAKIDLHQRLNSDTDAAWVYRSLQALYLNPEFLLELDWTSTDPELTALCASYRTAHSNRSKLKGKLDGVPRLKGTTFEGDDRGFVSCLWVLQNNPFLKHIDSIFRATPITAIKFSTLEPDDAAALLRSGHFARIRELSLQMVSRRTLEVLGNHEDVAGIRSLRLDRSDERTSELLTALGTGKHWTGLRKLELEGIDFYDETTPEQAAWLFRQPICAALRELSIQSCYLTDPMLRAIASVNMPELRFLNLASNRIGGSGTRALAQSTGLPALRYLNLNYNQILQNTAVAEVINSPKLPNLTVLTLNGREIASPDPRMLAGPGRNPTLRVLQLDFGQLTTNSASALASCPALRGLWLLSFERPTPGIFDDAVKALTQAAGFDKLVILDLRGNRLKAGAARMIAAWPKAACLQWLGLSDNLLTVAGLAELADSPHLGKLKRLLVSGPESSDAMKKLKKRFRIK
jgi:uncharacterized protein (TIGR02996 family)